MARLQRRGDGVERVGQRAGDLVLGQVARDDLDVVGVRLQPVVVVRRDPVAEHVDRLRLAAEAAVSSSEMNTSGRSAISITPSIVS